jgi:hypothetical protein
LPFDDNINFHKVSQCRLESLFSCPLFQSWGGFSFFPIHSLTLVNFIEKRTNIAFKSTIICLGSSLIWYCIC